MGSRKNRIIDLFKDDLKKRNMTLADFSISVGLSYASLRVMLRKKEGDVPKWVMSYLLGRGYDIRGNDLFGSMRVNTVKEYVCISCMKESV